MRNQLLLLSMLLIPLAPATAQVSVSIGVPTLNIGINVPTYPELVAVPGYPVYYAPGLQSNYFFYDGMYWVYDRDNWYASSWYNGPWGLVGPESVPAYVLRVPVRYYRQPPAYFRGWRSNASPHWGEHWGADWQRRRAGWEHASPGAVRTPAPLPVYQRQYSGDRYPRTEQQPVLHGEPYRYQPRDPVVREHYETQHLNQHANAAPMPHGPPQREGRGQDRGRDQDDERGRERK